MDRRPRRTVENNSQGLDMRDRQGVKHKRRGRLHATCEQMENRLLFSVGGGFSGSGLVGQYFNAPVVDSSPADSFTGTSTFQRTDVRVDFAGANTVSPGGGISTDPMFGAIGSTNFAVKWTGSIIPRFGETYTFKTITDEGVRLIVNGSTIINDWSHTTATTDTASVTLNAGQTYSIEMDYFHGGGAWTAQLHWTSPSIQVAMNSSTAEEAIEPASPVGINFEPDPKVLADAMRSASDNLTSPFTATVFGSAVPTDSKGWPSADFAISGLLSYPEVSNDTDGTYLLQFTGKADVSIAYGATLDFKSVDGLTDYGSTLASGQGFDGTKTTVTFQASNIINQIDLKFSNTRRTATSALGTGVTDIRVMRPVSEGSTTYSALGTVFTPSALALAAPFTTLRMMDWLSTNGSTDANWSDRVLPSVASYPATGKQEWPWEQAIAVANATGKDLYINIPAEATNDYLTQLASLFKNGDTVDGVFYPGLLPHLKVYIEWSNEVWNGSFLQSGNYHYNQGDAASAGGQAGQASLQAVHDYLAGNTSASDYADGRAIDYDNSIATPVWDSTYSRWQADPATVNNGWERWMGARTVDAANIFKTAFGETAIAASSSAARIRPLIEYQYGGGAGSGALALIQAYYGSSTYVTTPQPTNFYIYGAGSGWYADTFGSSWNNGFNDAVFSNPSFTSGTSGWTFSSGGVVANGDATLNPPNAPAGFAPAGIADSTHSAYLSPGGTAYQDVTFSTSGYANLTFYGTQSVTSDNVTGLMVSVDGGAPIQSSEGGYQSLYSTTPSWAGGPDVYIFARTAAFYATAGTHRIWFKSTLSSGTVFFNDVAIQTANKLIAEASSSAVQNTQVNNTAPGLNITSETQSDVVLNQSYGVHTVGYEGGFDFNENLAFGSYDSLGKAGYPSLVANIGMYANNDPATTQLAKNTINQYFSAGGDLPIIFQSSGSGVNSWSVAVPDIFVANNASSVPRLAAVLAVGQALPPSSASALPQGWTDSDIGAPGVIGSALQIPATGKWIVSGGGSFGTMSDSLNYVSRSWSGDGTITVNVTNNGDVSAYAQTSVMFRDSNAANSSYVALILDASNRVYVQSRNGTGASATGGTAVTGISTPQYLRLTRAGNSFTAYISSDGSSWTQVGSSVTTDLSTSGLVGMGVDSSYGGRNNTADFSNVSVNYPGGWADTVVDGPNQIGIAQDVGGAWTVNGPAYLGVIGYPGGFIQSYSGNIDGFNYVHQNWTGDGSFVAELTGDSPSQNWHYNDGIMLRDDTTASSSFVSLTVYSASSTSTRVADFQYRNGANTVDVDSATASASLPLWLKLTRSGTTFSAFTSTDGTTWTQLGSNATVSLAGTGLAGMFNSDTTTDPATFTNVSLNQSTTLPVIADAGFETPSVGAGSYAFDPSGSGWIFGSTRTGIEANGSGWTSVSAPEGTQAAVLQNYGTVATVASISQSIMMSPGTYAISYQAAQRTLGGANPIQFSVDGTNVGSVVSPGPSFTSYTTSSFTITTAGMHTIEFAGTATSGDDTAFIDNVTIAAVVPPVVIADAGFETPALTAGTYQFNPTGSGWTFGSSRTGIEANDSGWTSATAPEGTQAAVLQNYGTVAVAASVSQSVTFAVGTYTATFSAAQRTLGGANPIQFSVNGTNVGSPITATSTFASYTTTTFHIGAAGAYTIEFAGTATTGDDTAFIDNVSITDPPANKDTVLVPPTGSSTNKPHGHKSVFNTGNVIGSKDGHSPAMKFANPAIATWGQTFKGFAGTDKANETTNAALDDKSKSKRDLLES